MRHFGQSGRCSATRRGQALNRLDANVGAAGNRRRRRLGVNCCQHRIGKGHAAPRFTDPGRQGIRTQPLRAALIILAMSIGVASVNVLTALGDSARRYVVHEFESLGTHLVIVLPAATKPPAAIRRYSAKRRAI